MKTLEVTIKSTINTICSIIIGIILGSLLTTISIKESCDKHNQFLIFKNIFECNKK
jgi:hypothetical protein